MNSTCYDDVYMRVRAESDEMYGAGEQERALYEGIYNVTLNGTVDITFIPAFQRDKNSWPPLLRPTDSGTFPVETTEQARSSTAALADYVVTVACCEEQNVQPFVLEGFDDVPSSHGILFPVSLREFEQFAYDLWELAGETVGRTSGMKLSEVQQYSVVQFLLSRVICSPHFSKQDAWVLENRALLMK